MCSSNLINFINYFTNIYTDRNLNEATVIFPDKFTNAEGYNITALALPSTTKDKFGNLHSSLDLDKVAIPLLSIALKKVNLSLNLEHFSEWRLKWENRRYYNSRINIVLRPTLIDQDQIIWPILHVSDECQKIVAVVPLLPDHQSIRSGHVIPYLGIVVILLVIVTCVQKVFFNNGKYWNAINVTELLIGMTATVPPRTIMEKICFLCFILISMKYSSEFYSEIVDIKFVHKTVPFDTFKQIIDSNLSIYSNPILMGLIDKNNDPYVEIIKRKVARSSTLSFSISLCLLNLRILKRKLICITIEAIAIEHLNPVIKIAKPVFHCVEWVYQMEAGSPYAEKLQSIISRLVETGIADYFKKYKKFYSNPVCEGNQEDLSITNILLVVLIAGYSASIIIFKCELISKWLKSRRKKIQSII